MNNIYSFKYSFYSEYEDKDISECGFLNASNYDEAMKKILEEFENTDNIQYININLINDNVGVVYTQDKFFEDVKKSNQF